MWLKIIGNLGFCGRNHERAVTSFHKKLFIAIYVEVQWNEFARLCFMKFQDKTKNVYNKWSQFIENSIVYVDSPLLCWICSVSTQFFQWFPFFSKPIKISGVSTCEQMKSLWNLDSFYKICILSFYLSTVLTLK